MAKRLIIADDHPIYRQTLKNLLENYDFEIAAEAGDGKKALEKVEEIKPDLLLLDVNMPKIDGMKVLEILKKRSPDLKIIMLTMYRHLMQEAIDAGADGYCVKDCSPRKLLDGIEIVFKGKTFICVE